MSSFYIGVFVGLIIGACAGITIAAILVAAREESRDILHRDRGWRND